MSVVEPEEEPDVVSEDCAWIGVFCWLCSSDIFVLILF
jgi:hypothetical protein